MAAEACDIELIAVGNGQPVSNSRSRLARYRDFSKMYESIQRFIPSPCPTKQPLQAPLQVEDYPQGYPRFAALISAHPSFHVYRRFSTVRARILLLKQDRVLRLEEQLHAIDQMESRPMFLGSARRDGNVKRAEILAELEIALADYDTHVQRIRATIRAPGATPHAIASLQNWVAGTGAIARAETEFLAKERDLMVLSCEPDELLSSLETLLSLYFQTSRDCQVRVFSGVVLQSVCRGLIAWSTVSIILMPVILLSSVRGLANRMTVIVFASAVFIASLSYLVKASTRDIFLAGATYAAVLVVFLDGK